MPDVIISDTSCLIVLSNICELELLHRVYGNIITTKEVADEFGEDIPAWITVHSAANVHYQTLLSMQVDRGEASAIALAIEYNDCLLMVDDMKARKVAIKLGLTITGTIGVIAKAKSLGYISAVEPYLKKIKDTDFRISDELYELVLREVGEL